MLCVCHGVEVEWQTDSRRKRGGYWRCRVKNRQSVVRMNEDKDARRRRQLAYWHKANGGYVKRRRRQLRNQRDQVVRLLMELEQEAAVCRSRVTRGTRRS